MRLSVATYNICHCADYSKDEEGATVDIAKTASVIKKTGADVVTLNEVYSVGEEECFVAQADKLSQKVGFPHFVYAQGASFEWGGDIGNAVLSSFPLSEVEKIPVPSPIGDERDPSEDEWYEDRVIVKATVNAEVPFVIITTHFGLNGREQKRMVETLEKVLDGEKRPTVLTGDFNALPNAEILVPIYARMKSVARELKNTDPTFSSFKPERTLDYIFVSKSIKCLQYEVVKERVSDHFPIKAILEIK